MELCIAVTGFRGRDWKFLPKEIAVASVTGNILAHWVLAPPYAFTDLPPTVRVENNRRTQFLHKIEWFEGDSKVETVCNQLLQIVKSADGVYTLGEEARLFLTKLLCREVKNMEHRRNWELFVQRFPTKTMCLLHGLKNCSNQGFCAVTVARQIKKWFLPLLPPETENVPQIDSNCLETEV